MAILITDDLGRPVPQYQNKNTGTMEACKGINGAMDINAINEVVIKSAPSANQTDPLKVQQTGALPVGTNKIGGVSITDPLPAGTNKIGNVEIENALPAGTNNIGKIEVTNLPAIPTGSNKIGSIQIVSDDSPADVLDHSLATIDHMHKEIHEGNCYVISRIFPAVANDAYAEFRITTSSNDNALPHISFDVTSENGKAYISLLEASTFTSNGTVITPVNLKRSSTNISNNTIYHTPTVNATGTVLYNNMVGSTGGQKQGGNIRANFEFNLKTSTEYVFRVQNKAGSTQDISIVLTWYEMIS